MARQSNTEEILASLSKMEKHPLTADDTKYLIKVLSGPNGNVAARSAQVLARTGNGGFIPYLSAAFVHYMERPERDKGCWAKQAICRALESLGCRDPEVFLKGVRYVQMEPVWGRREDSAGGLRGVCAVALTRMLYPEVHFELAALLTDTEPSVRRTAVNAVSSLGCERSELLLRMKVLAGDSDPEIVGMCFAGLMGMAVSRSVPFVGRYLSSDDPLIVRQAAVALGESGDDLAFEVLLSCWKNNSDLLMVEPLLMGLALTRCDEAFHILLEVVADDGQENALVSVRALEIYASDTRRRKVIEEAVNARRDAKVLQAFAEYCE